MTNKFWILPALALASCAPTVQQEPVYTATQSYKATCPVALSALTDVAVRTKPAVLLGFNTWSTLSVADRTENRVMYVSRNGSAVVSYGMVTPLNMSVITTATCTQNNDLATIRMISSGQSERFMSTLHDALFKGINLPQ